MGLRDRPDLSDQHERWLVRALQLVLVGAVLVGVYRRQVSIVVNAGVSLAITFVPGLLERERDLTVDPVIVLWITVAVTVHAIGALGPYRQFAWYDQVAHTLSATIVAGVGYAGAKALDLHSDDVEIPSEYMFGFVVVFVFAAGVCWELIEFATGLLARLVAGDAVLAQYGIDDIVHDLLFNAVGGAVVAVLDTPSLRDLARSIAGQAD